MSTDSIGYGHDEGSTTHSSPATAARMPGSAPPAPVHSRPGAKRNVGDDERLLSLAAGGLLAGVAAAKRGPFGLVLAGIGASLIYRAVTGHCHGYGALGINTAPQNRGVRPEHGVWVSRRLHINRTPEEVSEVWGPLTNLPKVMRHLDRVDLLEGNRSHWVANVLGMKFEWDAETTAFVEGREIRFRSLPGGDVDVEGAVKFEPNPSGGTVLRVEMRYDPPAGTVGDKLGRLVGADLRSQIDEDLNRFKAALETGAVSPQGDPTAQG